MGILLKTVTKKVKANYREKGSKFIGRLLPVYAVNDFNRHLQRLEEEYYDASHHCYGWRIDPNEKKEFAQDDGEPSGTAGLPILNKLKSFEVINAAIVVIRYFGGTELGKSGLIKAYSLTAERCLQKVRLKPIVATQNFKITYPYDKQSQINQLKNSFDLKEIDATYLAKVTLKIACRQAEAAAFYEAVQQLSHLNVEVEEKDQSYVVMNG